jgi:hypothetical protein
VDIEVALLEQRAEQRKLHGMTPGPLVSTHAFNTVISACKTLDAAAEMLHKTYGIEMRSAKKTLRREGSYDQDGV